MPKYLRLASDIHLDFDAEAWAELPNYHPQRLARTPELDFLWQPEPLPTDGDTIMLIPGDLWVENRAFMRRFGGPEAWVERISKRFHSVVLLLGNHDYWGTSLQRAPEKAKDAIKAYGLTNVHLLQNDCIVIGDVKLLGGTMWTDYDKKNPLIIQRAPDVMNDFENIRYRVGNGNGGINRPLWVKDILASHDETRKFILTNARRDYPEQKVVVLSHHAPSWDSIAEEYRTSSSWDDNFFYFSELGWDLCAEEVQVDLWVHGHCHRAADYEVDRTRVLCNPRGYFGHETADTTGFNPTLRLEVAQLRAAPLPEDELPKAIPILEEPYGETEDNPDQVD